MDSNIKNFNTFKASSPVIKRLPRYFRYLRILQREGITHISSSNLAKRMRVTSSQIRQDLNCFGGFGQQGYGYNVDSLYANICELLGVSSNLHVVIIGAGNLGKALVRSDMFQKRNIDIIGLFDNDETIIGKEYNGIKVYSMEELSSIIKDAKVQIAVLVVPKACAEEVANKCVEAGVDGIWNFSGAELAEIKDKVALENVHLGDSLMTLCYNVLKTNKEEK